MEFVLDLQNLDVADGAGQSGTDAGFGMLLQSGVSIGPECYSVDCW